LKQSGCAEIEGVNDADGWKAVMDAMNVLQFSEADVFGILQCLAVILHLGNISFVAGEKVTLITFKRILITFPGKFITCF
jgi:myosin heavy subunit